MSFSHSELNLESLLISAGHTIDHLGDYKINSWVGHLKVLFSFTAWSNPLI